MKKSTSLLSLSNRKKSNLEEALSDSDQSSSSYSSTEKVNVIKNDSANKLKTELEIKTKNKNRLIDQNDIKNNELRTAKRIIEGLRPIKSSNESINISPKSSKDLDDSNNFREKEINNSRLRIRKLSSSFSSASSNSFPLKRRLISSKKKGDKNLNNEKLKNRLKIKYSDDEFEFEDDIDENLNGSNVKYSLNKSNQSVNKAGVNNKTIISNRQKVNKSTLASNKNDNKSNNIGISKKIKLKCNNSDDSSEDNFQIGLTQKKTIENHETNNTNNSNKNLKKTNSKTIEMDDLSENVEKYIKNIEEDEQNDSCSEGNITNSTFITACEDVFITDVTSGVITVTIKESSTPDGFFKKRDQE